MARQQKRDTVYIPTPLEHQRAPLASDARFKLWRWGRRTGKTRAKLRASIMGHGPKVVREQKTGKILCGYTPGMEMPAGCYPSRLYRGVVEGARIAWVAKDYPQSREVWEEEIRARFSNANHCEVREADKILRISRGWGFKRGQLEVRSMESIDGMRGFKYDGVDVDEAAHVELQYAWRRVLRPTLTDSGGWAIMASTTKIGSFFNQLCTEVEAGNRTVTGPNRWESIHLTTNDNKALKADEIADLRADYPPGSTDAMEELDAELLEAHGELFTSAYFDMCYESASPDGMTIKGVFHPFSEVILLCDLASSLKQEADYTCGMIVGFTPKVAGQRKCGVLFVEMKKLEGPGQIDLFEKMLNDWAVTEANIESVAYQLTAVQHLRVRTTKQIKPYRVDRDKRSRAVPWAAAMARGDVFWPARAPWKEVVVKQHLRFKGGDTRHGLRIEDHDDSVDCGSMAAVRLARVPASVGFRPVSV